MQMPTPGNEARSKNEKMQEARAGANPQANRFGTHRRAQGNHRTGPRRRAQDAEHRARPGRFGLGRAASLAWVCIALALSSLAPATAQAQTVVADDWALKPAGLGVGDKFRLIFATSTDIADYNTFVQNRAAQGHSAIRSYGDGFQAVGCTEGVDARDNTETTYTTSDKGVPIYWLGGAKVADDYEDFYDGSWDDETNTKDEFGTARDLSGSSSPFTGCEHDGTEEISAGQSRALGKNSVRVGEPNSTNTNSGPISGNHGRSPGQSRPFYALSQVLRVERETRATTPGAPTNVTAEAGNGWVTLTWEAPTDTGGAEITSYEYRHAEGTEVPVGTGWTDAGDVTEVTIRGLTTNTDHAFEVRAVNRGGGGTAAPVTAATVAPEQTACPTHAEWCETLTSGYSIRTLGVVTAEQFGFVGMLNYPGALSNTDFTHAGTDHSVSYIHMVKGVLGSGAISGHTLGFITNADVPDGTVLDVNGTELTVGAESHNANVGKEVWDLKDLGIELTWGRGQKITVSLNFPPTLESAQVAGTTLTLTYHEDLDAGSTPAESAYAVEVDGTEVTPSGASIVGRRVNLTLATGVTAGQTVTVTYTVPTSNPVKDQAGIEAHALTDESVENYTGRNSPPVLDNAIPDQTAQEGVAFSYQLPEDTFSDPDDTPRYRAAQSDGSALPSWLTFTASTRTFSGTPGSTDTGRLTVKVTASDGTSEASDEFVIKVGSECTVDLAGRAEIWSGTVTVEKQGVGTGEQPYGYVSGKAGTLSDDAFDFNLRFGILFQEITVDTGGSMGGGLNVRWDSDVREEDVPALRLHACGRTFELDEAEERSGGGIARYWADTGLDWSAENTVSLALSAGTELGLRRLGLTDEDGNEIGLNQKFNPERRSYTAQSAAAQVTVHAEKMEKGQLIRYRDIHNDVLADADRHTAGFQIMLTASYEVVQVQSTSGDRSNQIVYLLTIEKIEDTAAPEVASATAEGRTVSIEFNEGLKAAPNLTNSAFTVKRTPHGASEETVALNGAPTVSGKMVRLELATAVEIGDTVRVTYTRPSTGTDNRIADDDGNEAASFTTAAKNETGTGRRGDVRIVEEPVVVARVDTDNDGHSDSSIVRRGPGKGRLEVFYKGQWGTVCNDRFTSDFTDHSKPGKPTVANIAAQFACQLAGFETGSAVRLASSGAKAPAWKKILLDDVRCAEGSRHWREEAGLETTQLDHCYHAGVGLHNCTHDENVHLNCTEESASAPQTAAPTAAFEDAPDGHDGTSAFTLRLRFSAPIANPQADMRDHAVNVTGGTLESAEQVSGASELWTLTIAPGGANDVTVTVEGGGTCGTPGAICTSEGAALAATASATVAHAPAATPPLTVRFENAPATHDGTSEFKIDAIFSEAPAGMSNADILAAVNVTGGTKVKARKVRRSETHRRIWIAPGGASTITVSFPPTLDCNDPNAICSASGGRLEGLASVQIPATPTAGEPQALTARFVDPPAEHQGKTAIGIRIELSEPPTGGRTALAQAFNVTRAAQWGTGTVGKSARRFETTVRPNGWKPITVTLAATQDCDDAGALCTADGKRLEEGIEITIPGPVAIRIADAEVEEAPGAVLAFAVTLDRASAGTVTVDYETHDGKGTATPGEDYTAVSGTLEFTPGETGKTIAVPVLDDAHDEGEETMHVRLSNANGARLADKQAKGTIKNTDHMPKAWTARVARGIAEQVFDAAKDRTSAVASPGTRATVAGVTLGAGASPQETHEGLDALARWMHESPREAESRRISGRDLLSGSSFSLTAGGARPGAGTGSVWGRGAISRFSGTEDKLTLKGEIASAILGGDFSHGRWTAGAMIGHSIADGSYREGTHEGTVESTIIGLYPYGRYALNDRVTLWGVAGYGEGDLSLTPEGQKTIETGMDLSMAALGLRGMVVEAPAEGGPEIALTTDALGVRTTSDEAPGELVATTATVTRLRLGAQSAWHGLTIGTGALTPRLELGLRHDGGDAETGFGVEVGAALGWADPARGLNAEVGARGLLTHESDGVSERGLAGSIAYDPRPASDRGLSWSLRQSIGAPASGGVDALLGHRTLEGLGAGDGDELSRRRLEMRVGYGLPAFGGRFTATPEVGVGLSEGARDYRAGWRLGLARNDPASVELNVQATRRESPGADATEHGVGVSLTAQW